jgi:hypothetical protein
VNKSFDVPAMPGSVAGSHESFKALWASTNYYWSAPHLLTHEKIPSTFEHEAQLRVCFSPLILSMYQRGYYTYDRYESLEALIPALRGILRKDLKMSGLVSVDRRIDDACQTLAVFAASFDRDQPEIACELRRMCEAVYDRPCEAPEHLKRAFAGAAQTCADLAEAHEKSKH